MRALLLTTLLSSGCLVAGESPFREVEVEPPTVTATNPHNGVDNVPVSVDIDLQFSEPLDASSITADAIVVQSGGVVTGGTVAFDRAGQRIYTFVPLEPLLAEVTYRVTVSDQVTDRFYNTMADDFTFDFTTSANPDPMVVATVDPPDQATDVAVDAIVTVTVTRPLEPSVINRVHFALSDAAGTVLTRVTAQPGDLAVEIEPIRDLAPGEAYTVTVSAAVKDIAGQRLGLDHTTTFTTAP